MATNSRQELDKKTKKLSSSGPIENGKEHAAYQETQQQLLAIQAERQQNLALARAESKADSNLNQTLAQAAELGAVSAAEAEQAAMAGQVQTLNPATQAVLSKYGMGQPRVQRSSFQNRQVTRQNVTINNNTTVTTKNDVNVPTGGGPLQGRPVQFKTPSQQDSAGRFRSWLSSAFARQKEEGERRDREYRHRESSLTKSASRMMKKLEDIGKTIGTRLDPRKIGSTWQSQLKTLLFLFGFGYLAQNWVDILKKIDTVGDWIKGTWTYFTGGGKGQDTPFISSIKSLLGARGSESFAEIFRNLLIGDDKNGEKGLFGHIKQFFTDFMDERARAVKLVKFPSLDPEDFKKDPLKLAEQLFGYLGDIMSAMVGGLDNIKQQRINEVKSITDSQADQERKKNSPSDKYISRTVNGEKTNVEQGSLAYKNSFGQKEYKGVSHHMLDNGELTDRFGAESSMAQMSELDRLVTTSRATGNYNAEAIATAVGRLSKFAGKKGFIPINKHSLTSILTAEEIQRLVNEGKLRRNIPYRVVIRPKNDEDYYRNFYGNNYKDPKLHVGASAAIHTYGAKTFADGGRLWSAKTVFNNPGKKKIDGGIIDWVYYSQTDAGNIEYVNDVVNEAESKIKDHQAKYRHEFIRADSPLRPGDIDTGEIEYLDEISKEGLRDVSKMILSRYNKNFDENTVVDPENFVDYVNLIKQGAVDQFEGYKQERLKQIDKELGNLSGSITTPVPLRPDDTIRFTPNIVPEFGSIDTTTNTENNSKRIEELKKERKDLQNRNATTLIDSSTNLLDDTMSDLKESLDWKQERDRQRQEDWDNSAAGRMANTWNEKIITPITETATSIGGKLINIVAGKGNVDDAELKRRKLYLMKVLTEKGLSKAAAAGIIGNLEGEGLKNKTDEWHDDPNSKHPDGKSVGIAQFHNYGMFPALEKWAKDRGRRWEDFETQADFIAEHAVTKKIANLTKNLSPQDSLKKSAIIWGRDFEVFTGHDAADKNYNIVGRGTRNSSGQYGDENYANRIKMGLTTYNNYSNENLDSITLQTGSGSDGPVIPGTVDQKWVMCVNDVTKWYSKSIPTYNGGNGSPKYYKSKWGEVRDDCSGLVSACISAYTESSFDSDSTNLSFKDNEIGKKLEGAGFGYIKFTSWGALKPYDIIVSQGHTEIYAGNINGQECSFSWGSLHNTKTNPSGPPWPSDKSKEYKVIWRNGSGSGPDFMYNNGIQKLNNENEQGETSFLSIMFSSITETLKNFSQGLASSNSDAASAFGKGLGQLVDKAEKIIGKTGDVESAIKEKEIPKIESSKTVENSSVYNSSVTTQPTNIDSSTSKISELMSDGKLKDINNFTDSDYEIFRKAAIESSSTGGFYDMNFPLFNKILKEKHGIKFPVGNFEKWFDGLKNDQQTKFRKNVFEKMPKGSNLVSYGQLKYSPNINTTPIDYFKFSNTDNFTPPILNKDTSFIDEVNKNREETSIALQDNAKLTSKTIAGGIDHLSDVFYQCTQYQANVFGSSNNGGQNQVKVGDSISQTNAQGIGHG